MRLTKYLPLIVLVCVARAHGQEPVRPQPTRPPATGPGLVLTAAQLLAPPPVLRLGLGPVPSTYLAELPHWSAPYPIVEGTVPAGRPLRLLPVLPREGRGVRPGFGIPSDPTVAALLAAPDPAADSDTSAEPDVAAGDATPGAADATPGAADATPGLTQLALPSVLQDAADLSLRVEGRGELGGAWNQYRPCEPGLRLKCSPDLFPRLQPDIQFGVQVGGTITDRLHVDVDYDQRREFDAANNISVYYEGREGEFLQRMEMGDVSIDLPASRYLTQGIPAGNFGFKAAARVGSTDLEAVWAQQKGDIATREFRLGGAGQAGLVQDQELVLDDADYASGQFFFLVDPSRLAGWPAVDVLALDHADAPASVRPRGDRLVVYRDEGRTGGMAADPGQGGKFLANAVSADGSLEHSGLFRLLEPGTDYYIHSSGLWIALRAPLRDDEALAVAYVTETGSAVGDLDAESRPPGDTPELRLIRGPVTIHQPGQPTWPWEMHQVYRLDSSTDAKLSTLDLTISLGHLAGGVTFEEFAGRQIPLLRLFGLDDDAPADRIDPTHVFRPGSELDGMGGAAVRGTFIVFPTLEPFWRPPPVPSEGLSAAEAAEALGSDANAAIYQEVDPVVRRSSSRFRLNFRYRVELEGLLSSFNLGAFGIRQGSERISVDDRLLVRGVDYVIDYDLGLVTLLDPRATLGANPDAEIRANWEQKALFDIAPTTVFGLRARSPLGPYGELNLVGMYQAEQSIVRRPQLGTAPGAVMLGGASGRLAFQADWLRRLLESVPLLSVDSVARLDVAGELALSSPDPNRKGATYLDDFEATDEIPLSLDAAEWQLGSAPQDATGVATLPWPLTPDNAASLVWQDRYLADGREVGFLTAQEIDQQIAYAGARLAERVLYLTLDGDPPAAPTPHWRSVTTILSTTGRDLSRSEYLEFYAAPYAAAVDGATLVLDIGSVGEDAFYFDESGALAGTDQYGRPWGQGTLDEEARVALREVWGPAADRRGLWDQSCEADRLNPVPLGDPRADCTVLNGRPDTEDLNGNGVLDAADGPTFRYVIPLGPDSPYLVRGQAETETPFRLFRIPLRGAGAVPLNGASEATWRYIRNIRLTVVKPSPGRGTLALARLRIAGSRWTKREVDGVLGGLTGDTPGAGAEATNLRVGPVSALTEAGAYVSPPGVQDQLQDPKSAIGASGVEFNEKSLRLTWDALLPGERGEVYYRYPQQPRSFLDYRELRLWAVPRRGRWGPAGDHRLLVKLGTDARNYYVYQTPLRPVAEGASVSREDWLPEHVIEFQRWFELKAEAEQRLAESGGTGPIAVWSADSTYGVVMEDRARAPNLAAVRELTFAVYNAGSAETAGEVWLDELRLGAGAQQVGMAGRLDVNLDAGGFLSAAVSFGGRGGRFRQLDDAASYLSTGELAVNATAELGRFAPASWGLAMPVTASYDRDRYDPIFLQGTDVRASQLRGLRSTGSSRRRIGVSVRKTTPSSNPVVSALVDGTSLRLGYTRSQESTVTTSARLDGLDGGIEVDRRVADVGVGLMPGFVASFLRWLAPDGLERSTFFEHLTGVRLRLTPERVGFSAAYVSHDARVWRYDRVLETAADAAVTPIESPSRVLEGAARLALRPMESLTASVQVRTGRDLLDPARTTGVALEQQALRDARSDVAGIPLGWERNHLLTTDIAYRPPIADWLRPTVAWTSRFGQRRDPSYITVVETPEGPLPVLQRTYNADRRLSRGVVVDPAGGVRATIGTPLVGRLLAAALGPIKPVELTWTDEVGSRFDRDRAAPGLGYRLGAGGLESLRFVDGDTAATALERTGFRARSGIRFSATAGLDVGYSEVHGRTVDLRSGQRTQLERSWPDAQVTWQDVPVPLRLQGVLERWSFSTGFVRTERALTLRSATPRTISTRETTVPVEVRLGFAGGLSLSYIGSLTAGKGGDPTGRTEQDRLTHGVDVSGRFTAPFGLADGTIPEPVRLAVAYDYQAERQCRAAGNGGPNALCTPFIDYLNRRVNLTLSTLVSQLDVGLQVSWVDRRSYIGTQAGSSQFQLGLFGQFNLQAGTFGGP